MPAAIGGAAALIGPAIGAAGSIAGSLIQSGASGAAAGAQGNAAKQQLEWLQSNTQAPLANANWAQTQLIDWISGTTPQGAPSGFGLQAPGQAFQPFSFDPSSISNDPTYKWLVGQTGQNTLNAASTSGGVGGNALNQLSQNFAGLAGTYEPMMYNQAQQTWSGNQNALLNQQNQLYNYLSGISGQGLTTLGATEQPMMQAYANLGNANSAGIIGQGNAVTTGLNNLGTNAQMYNQLSQNPAVQGIGNNISNWFNGQGAMNNYPTDPNALYNTQGF